jgi:GNAT superfamily N-acetyltransferase
MLDTETTAFRIRALADGDIPTVESVFAQLSLGSAYHRFGTGLTRLPDRVAAALAAVTPGRQRVFVAERDGVPVGLARWVRPGGGRLDEAEVALEVADAWQGHGAGRLLLAEVGRDARTAGAETLLAYVAPGHARVVSWLDRLGAAPPRDLEGPHRLPVDAVLVSEPCACMTGCRCASSARCASGTGSGRTPLPAVIAHATSWPSWSPAAAARSRRRSSSTSCGAGPPPR